MTLTRVEDSLESGWEPLESGSRLLVGELVPGTRLKIIEWIGEGSMGQVFEAQHVDIQRRVALKVLRATFELSPEISTLFLDEAKACARIESRFVVEVMDFGELPDRRPFFVMELLGREDLHGALKPGRMPLARALPILRQCCKALAAIHEAGLVHRDIKPKNVVLQREDGRADAVRVVDLGLAAEPGSTPKISGTAPAALHGAARAAARGPSNERAGADYFAVSRLACRARSDLAALSGEIAGSAVVGRA